MNDALTTAGAARAFADRLKVAAAITLGTFAFSSSVLAQGSNENPYVPSSASPPSVVLPTADSDEDTATAADEQQDTAAKVPSPTRDTEVLAEMPEASLPAVQWIEDPGEPVLTGAWVIAPGAAQGTPGPRYALEKIVVQGNQKTLRQVILRYVELRAGEVFGADDPQLVRTRYRLLACGLFSEVELTLRRGSHRGWAVLVIRVKERNTIVVQDIVFGLSYLDSDPVYGSLDVAQRSFLGSGLKVSGAVVFSAEQYGYRLRFADDRFLDSAFALRAEGLYAHARDFFGKRNVHIESATEEVEFAELRYDRAGGRIGTGYTFAGDFFASVDYRFERVNSRVPLAGYHTSFGESRPIDYGHLLPGHSNLSALLLGLQRDTRNSPSLPTDGSRMMLEIELGTEMLGSDYEFSKFTLSHDIYFSLSRRQSLKLGLFAGLIMGDAPFFDQFFVGDFSAFVPARVLEMNFSHLQPNVLDTAIAEMRYQDLAASMGLEYSFAFYRGTGFVHAVSGFLGAGLFALASRQDLRHDPRGYEGYQAVPMDITVDLGVKIDTEIGLFVFSAANLFRLVPFLGREAAEE